MDRFFFEALDPLPGMWLTRDEYLAMNPVILQRPDGCAVLLTEADRGTRLMKAPPESFR